MHDRIDFEEPHTHCCDNHQGIITTTRTIPPLVMLKASTTPPFLGLTEEAVSARQVVTREVRAVEKARRPLTTTTTTIARPTPEWQAIVVSRTPRTLTSLVLAEGAVSKRPAGARPLVVKAVAAGMSVTMTSMMILALAKELELEQELELVALQRLP